MKKSNQSRKAAGFTLVEMLAVITIIVILAAVVIAGMKFVDEKSKREKAKVQVNLLAKALEEYKLDNGAYPPSSSETGDKESQKLRQVLFLDGKDDTTKKIYVGELDETNKQGWVTGKGTNATITDPWGNEYRYRSGKAASVPGSYDLWSVGKDTRTSADDPKAKESLDDVRSN